MGLMDAINPEERVSVTYSDFYALMRHSVKAELMMNGVKNKVDHDAIYTMMTGQHIPEPKEAANTEKIEKKVK